ncbi:hypothetical protein [Thiomicrorhabdus xiamenensis]|uniref:Uncharacterized protein n=1 Tax=Thiomicrorhabdus xiamenensis TaxID=2739063 RepID=A0A7D4SZV5_9GAMM|nr:hypothetical protein [Thiomicrorhabdus xiamenensis]QKI88505.1 hypothetical protein HQN79_02410 [Thiomicrorhabdus xiamenensis]
MVKERYRKEGGLFLLTACGGLVFWGWVIWQPLKNIMQGDNSLTHTLMQIAALGLSSLLFLAVLYVFALVGLRLIKS